LIRSIARKEYYITELLLKDPRTDPLIINGSGDDALSWLASLNNFSLFFIIWNKYFDHINPNRFNSTGSNILGFAIDNNNLELVELILTHPKIFFMLYLRRPILYRALNKQDILLSLLSHPKIRANEEDTDGKGNRFSNRIPIKVALKNNNFNAFKLLIFFHLTDNTLSTEILINDVEFLKIMIVTYGFSALTNNTINGIKFAPEIIKNVTKELKGKNTSTIMSWIKSFDLQLIHAAFLLILTRAIDSEYLSFNSIIEHDHFTNTKQELTFGIIAQTVNKVHNLINDLTKNFNSDEHNARLEKIKRNNIIRYLQITCKLNDDTRERLFLLTYESSLIMIPLKYKKFMTNVFVLRLLNEW
jgi:hypothetical protein